MEAEKPACALCGRVVEQLTQHHLIPRTRHKNKRNKKDFDRQEVRQCVFLCLPCHKNLHAHISNKELERQFNQLQELARHPAVEKFTAWIKKRPDGTRAPSYQSSKKGNHG